MKNQWGGEKMDKMGQPANGQGFNNFYFLAFLLLKAYVINNV